MGGLRSVARRGPESRLKNKDLKYVSKEVGGNLLVFLTKRPMLTPRPHWTLVRSGKRSISSCAFNIISRFCALNSLMATWLAHFDARLTAITLFGLCLGRPWEIESILSPSWVESR